jgi:hypothetical protein
MILNLLDNSEVFKRALAFKRLKNAQNANCRFSAISSTIEAFVLGRKTSLPGPGLDSYYLVKSVQSSLKCEECGHVWVYLGKQKRFAKCPECGRRIKLSDPRE